MIILAQISSKHSKDKKNKINLLKEKLDFLNKISLLTSKIKDIKKSCNRAFDVMITKVYNTIDDVTSTTLDQIKKNKSGFNNDLEYIN